jgi:hypothetical protein
MTDKGTLDRLSAAELARHRDELLYAEIQLCKRGDYETVARRLRRSARVALCANLCMLAAIAVAVLLGLHFWMVFVQVACMAIFATYRFAHAQRTAETVARLAEERKRSERLPA